MRSRSIAALVATLLGASVLVGCGSDSDTEDATGETTAGNESPAQEPAEEPAEEPEEPDLTTADSPVGTIVVDGNGRAVYLYDEDTQGAGESVCTGDCATAWPAVPAGGGSPTVDGVTGEVGTITGVDGAPQLTLDGWPLYYYVEDAEPGDITGQAVGDVWWLLAPDGSRITEVVEESGTGGYGGY